MSVPTTLDMPARHAAGITSRPRAAAIADRGANAVRTVRATARRAVSRTAGHFG
jgi:hypothetical protein